MWLVKKVPMASARGSFFHPTCHSTTVGCPLRMPWSKKWKAQHRTAHSNTFGSGSNCQDGCTYPRSGGQFSHLRGLERRNPTSTAELSTVDNGLQQQHLLDSIPTYWGAGRVFRRHANPSLMNLVRVTAIHVLVPCSELNSGLRIRYRIRNSSYTGK